MLRARSVSFCKKPVHSFAQLHKMSNSLYVILALKVEGGKINQRNGHIPRCKASLCELRLGGSKTCLETIYIGDAS